MVSCNIYLEPFDFLFDLGTLKSMEYKLRSKDNIAVFRSQDSGKTNRSERINWRRLVSSLLLMVS